MDTTAQGWASSGPVAALGGVEVEVECKAICWWPRDESRPSPGEGRVGGGLNHIESQRNG